MISIHSLIMLSFQLYLCYSSQDKCCEMCTNGTEKYYSIPKHQPNYCGECCLDPNDYNKYKRFEPALTKANTSNPCQDYGFMVYEDTEIHGFGPVKVELDLYTI